jgi:putative tricarboxylic transport membrane protein
MQGAGISERAAEIVVAIVMFMVGVGMMLDNYQLGAGWAREGPQSGYFPFRIGAIICIASVAVLVQVLTSDKRRNAVFVTYAQLKPVLYVLVPTLVYVAAIQFIGIYVASTVFIAAFMRFMDKYSWLKIVAISIGFNAILFWLFEIQFLVPLPKGPLEALFGY